CHLLEPRERGLPNTDLQVATGHAQESRVGPEDDLAELYEGVHGRSYRSLFGRGEERFERLAEALLERGGGAIKAILLVVVEGVEDTRCPDLEVGIPMSEDLAKGPGDLGLDREGRSIVAPIGEELDDKSLERLGIGESLEGSGCL